MHNSSLPTKSSPVLEISASGIGEWTSDDAIRVNDPDWDGTVGDESLIVFGLQQWLDEKNTRRFTEKRCGLVLNGDDDLESIVQDLNLFSLIVIEFPHFTDGRGFSVATQLRERYQYGGPLRASGYLLVDQLSSLQRCGFDSFVFSNQVDAIEAVARLKGFSVAYQPSTSN
mgnify:CR=1 FL=1